MSFTSVGFDRHTSQHRGDGKQPNAPLNTLTLPAACTEERFRKDKVRGTPPRHHGQRGDGHDEEDDM